MNERTSLTSSARHDSNTKDIDTMLTTTAMLPSTPAAAATSPLARLFDQPVDESLSSAPLRAEPAAEEDFGTELGFLVDEPDPPARGLAVGCMLSMCVGAPIAMTLHDAIISHVVYDPAQALVASARAGHVLGGGIVGHELEAALSPPPDTKAGRVLEHHFALASGLMFGFGVYLMGRDSGGHNALALAVAETAFCACSHVYATAIRRRVARYWVEMGAFRAARYGAKARCDSESHLSDGHSQS